MFPECEGAPQPPPPLSGFKSPPGRRLSSHSGTAAGGPSTAAGCHGPALARGVPALLLRPPVGVHHPDSACFPAPHRNSPGGGSAHDCYRGGDGCALYWFNLFHFGLFLSFLKRFLNFLAFKNLQLLLIFCNMWLSHNCKNIFRNSDEREILAMLSITGIVLLARHVVDTPLFPRRVLPAGWGGGCCFVQDLICPTLLACHTTASSPPPRRRHALLRGVPRRHRA